MNKTIFIEILNDILSTYSFNRRRNTWFYNTNELERIVKLVKSKYSDSYYIDYGFNLTKLDDNKLIMHIYNRLGSIDINENRRIIELLDLSNSICSTNRIIELKYYINKYIIKYFENINSENELVLYLKTKDNLNDIPLSVKKYFNIE